MNSHTSGHVWAGACLLALVALFAVVAWGGKACEYLAGWAYRHQQRMARKAALKRHPAARFTDEQVYGMFADMALYFDLQTADEPDYDRRQP